MRYIYTSLSPFNEKAASVVASPFPQNKLKATHKCFDESKFFVLNLVILPVIMLMLDG